MKARLLLWALIVTPVAMAQTSGSGYPPFACSASIATQTFKDTTNNLIYTCVNNANAGYIWQLGQSPILPVTTAPTGACTAGIPNEQVTTSGVQYSCQNGTWGVVGSGAGLPPYGTILNQTTFADLTGWTPNGTTPTVSAGTLVFSGGAGTFTQSLDYNYQTQAPIFTQTCYWTVGTPGGATYGLGCGLRSNATNSSALRNALVRMDATTSGSAGTVYLVNGPSNTTLVTSATKVSFSAGDHLVITFSRNYDTITGSVQNVTTGTVPVSVSYTYAYAYSQTVFAPNEAKPAIYNFGGTQTITGMSLTSALPTGAEAICVGDSKTAGYYAGGYSQGWCQQMQATNYRTFPIAGNDDQTADIVANLPELVALKPKTVILMIGGNDVRASVAIGTIEANITTIVNTLTAAGIQVYIDTYPIENSGTSMTALNTWITTTYPTTSIDINHSFVAGSVPNTFIAADTIHPIANWHTYIAQTNSTFLQSKGIGQTLFAYKPAINVATLSGCSLGNPFGGPPALIYPGGGIWAGSFVSGTTGTCTVTITFPPAQGTVTGYACHASDVTTPADTLPQTLTNATTCIVSGTTVSGDVITWSAVAF